MELPQTFSNGIVVEKVEGPLVWINAEHTAISMTVTFGHYAGPLPFAAAGWDNEAHGRALFLAAAEGEFGEVQEYVAPEPTLFDYQQEFDALWPDVLLGMATDAEMARAKWLRAKIKELT